MLTLNTNIAAIRVANQLTRNQAEVNLALERLSTGQRINSAKDDAAGLAIATRFTAQINGQEVARRNAGDGISLAQTAEGGLETITSNLQRVRELAVQAANATNNAEDRAALDNEVQQRLAEVDRIARQTGFNGLNVLDGSLGMLDFQVGANVGDTIALDLRKGVRTTQMGAAAEAVLSLREDAFTDGELAADQTIELQVSGGDPASITLEAGSDRNAIAAAINAADIAGGITARAEKGGIRLLADDTITLGGNDLATVFDNPPATIDRAGDLTEASVRSVPGANATLVRVDDALDQVNGLRSKLGAIQNHFESTINTLGNSIENFSASRSRILDADFAAEVSRLARASVLEQAAIAVLGQANARNQLILRLLQ